MKSRARFFSLRRDSLRTRLMVWNMLTLALTLALVGGLILYTAQRSLMISIDREMENSRPPFRHLERDTPADIRDALLPPDQQNHPSENGPPPAAPNPAGGQSDRPNHPSDGDYPSHGRNRLDNPPTDGNTPAPGHPRDSEWHRPRIFDLIGAQVSPKGSAAPADPAAFREARAGRVTFADGIFSDEPARLLYTPMRFQGRVVAVTQHAHPMTEVNRALDGMRRALLTLIPVALLLAGLGGAWLTDRALRPVRQITFAAERIGADDLSRRLPAMGDDEFARLAATFNGMLARLELAFGQREALTRQLQEKIVQQQRFTGDASHELRTPLTIIKANASLLLPAQPTGAEWREGVEEINSAADSMTRLVQDLLLLTRSDGGQMGREMETLRIAKILEKAVQRVRPTRRRAPRFAGKRPDADAARQ